MLSHCKPTPLPPASKHAQLKFGMDRILSDEGSARGAVECSNPLRASSSLSFTCYVPFVVAAEERSCRCLPAGWMGCECALPLHWGGMHLSACSIYGTGRSSEACDLRQSAVGGGRRKRSWSRAVFSNLQRKGLEKRFTIQKYITKPDRRQLAATLGLTDAQVKVWFQNRRMKWRHSREGRPQAEELVHPPVPAVASSCCS